MTEKREQFLESLKQDSKQENSGIDYSQVVMAAQLGILNPNFEEDVRKVREKKDRNLEK